MSVYRDTNTGTVSFQHPIGTPLNATIKDAGGNVLWVSDPAAPIFPMPDFATGGNLYQLTVPWEVTQYDSVLTLEWSDGNGFVRSQDFSVVTPIVDFDRLMAVYPDQFAAYGDLVNLERLVRTVVQSYTGQSFGYYIGTKTYVGNGTGKLILAQRCNKLTGALGVYGGFPSDYVKIVRDDEGNIVSTTTNLNGELNLHRAGIAEDGWAITLNWPERLDVREAPPEELIGSGADNGGTIHVPRRFLSTRDKGAHYTFTGEWGYKSIPHDVTEAALLIANDYITGDSDYRDRYLSILKIQQDSFTYHPGAYRGTGNARADLLLGPFRRQTGMIIL